MSNTVSKGDQRSAKILHLSDIHVGMSEQDWMWPTIRQAFYDDLTRQHKRSGGWDLVIFTGDVAQTGHPDEYSRATAIFLDLWDHFRKLGSAPMLAVIPGNHDLQRPKSTSAASKVLQDIEQARDISDIFWTDAACEYRELVKTVFASFVAWREGLTACGIPMISLKNGILPGDFSSSCTLGDLSVGLIGLNSSWLQLSGDNFKARLLIGPQQFISVTDAKPDEWLARHDFNFVLTHHPLDWLSAGARDVWNSEIYTPNRFDAHFFGHMHAHKATTNSLWGEGTRRALQGSSLFGLEYIAQKPVQRSHGYSIVRLTHKSTNKSIRIWPRKSKKIDSGEYQLIPNFDVGLNDDGWAEIEYPTGASHKTLAAGIPETGENTPRAALNEVVERRSLDGLRRTLRYSATADAIRQVERDTALRALREQGLLWITSDWGMGSDEFLRHLQQCQGIDPRCSLIADVHAYSDYKSVLAGVEDIAGCTFEQLCELVSREPSCMFVFDDIALSEKTGDESAELQRSMEDLAHTIRQYCPNATIVLRSGSAPIDSGVTHVELRPLHLGDTGNFIRSHDSGGTSGLDQQNAVEAIHRHTDGIPAGLELAIKRVSTLGLSALLMMNSDIAGKQAVVHQASEAVAAAVADLVAGNRPELQRAMRLLKALSMFPRGERTETVRRFFPGVVLYDLDAVQLADRSLVDAVDVTSVHGYTAEQSKAILVKRSVREHLHSLMTDEDFSRMNNYALSTYFGDKWSSGVIKMRKGLHFDKGEGSEWQIGNASMMLLRASQRAMRRGKKNEIRGIVNLAAAYASALSTGSRYRSLMYFCNEILPVFGQVPDLEAFVEIMRKLHAKALRMSGELQEASELCQSLVSTVKSKRDLSSLYLNLALCFRGLQQPIEAIEAAKQVMELNPRSNSSAQAESIILTQDQGLSEADRVSKIDEAETRARRKKHHIVANNLALSRALRTQDLSERRRAIEDVLRFSLDGGDRVNNMRARVALTNVVLAADEAMTPALITSTIQAYYYFYDEEKGSNLDLAHDALWKAFTSLGEVDNLLQLFRRSSILWQVRRRERIETKYLELLAPLVSNAVDRSLRLPKKEFQYYLARSNGGAKQAIVKTSNLEVTGPA